METVKFEINLQDLNETLDMTDRERYQFFLDKGYITNPEDIKKLKKYIQQLDLVDFAFNPQEEEVEPLNNEKKNENK